MPSSEQLFHFETMANRPRVFRITAELVADAKSRNRSVTKTSLGEDLDDMSWVSQAVGLITHNDILLKSEIPVARACGGRASLALDSHYRSRHRTFAAARLAASSSRVDEQQRRSCGKNR